jgi:hypothetical protein
MPGSLSTSSGSRRDLRIKRSSGSTGEVCRDRSDYRRRVSGGQAVASCFVIAGSDLVGIRLLEVHLLRIC